VCHFGQFFSYERSDSRVGIVGVQLDDSDVGETCVYPQTECANLDVLTSALRGAVSLNSRTGIRFYLESRGSTGFTAFITKSNTAVKTIYYQVPLRRAARARSRGMAKYARSVGGDV
jgi:hypothetical protein